MPKIAMLNQEGAKVGEIELSEAIFASEINESVLHLVVRSQLAAKRQGTQSAKTRGEVRGGGGGAVGAENVGLIGDAEGLKLLAGTLYNGPVRVASHNDCYFFHAILLKKIKMQIKKG